MLKKTKKTVRTLMIDSDLLDDAGSGSLRFSLELNTFLPAMDHHEMGSQN